MEASPRYTRAFEIVVTHEGGFVWNPRDPGGATKLGISLRYARTKGLRFDLDGDGDVDVDDIRRVDADTAHRAFWEDFWSPCKCDELPPELALLVFDAAVNSGPGQAVEWLQRACQVKPDRIIGPVTLGFALNPRVPELFQMRRLRAMQTMRWEDFGRGWSSRVLELSYQARAYAAEVAAAPVGQGALL